MAPGPLLYDYIQGVSIRIYPKRLTIRRLHLAVGTVRMFIGVPNNY